MIAFPAYQLPPGFAPERTYEHPEAGVNSGVDGNRLRIADFSAGRADDLLRSLRAAARGLRSRPVRRLVELLGHAGERFLDDGDPLTREAKSRLPTEARLSEEMAHEVIRGMARDWTPGRLASLLTADFPDPSVLDGFRPAPAGGRIRAVGFRLASHIGAGNVPGVGATSLLRSLLVKTPVLLKPGLGDVVLSCLLARAVAEADETLAAAVAVVYWPGGVGSALEEAALRAAEQVVAYGGPDALVRLRERVPAATPFLVYPHRMSMGAVGREALSTEAGALLVAEEAARAVAMFDQRGCVSPQVVWVEDGGSVTPRAWARVLAKALAELERTLPQGPPDPAIASRIHQLRGTAELRRASGTEDELITEDGARWTVLFDTDPGPFSPCLGRTVRVRPLSSLERLEDILPAFQPLLQTFAVAGGARTVDRIAEGLVASGVTRITTFVDQPWPPPWWRHDGTGPLLSLVRWTGIES